MDTAPIRAALTAFCDIAEDDDRYPLHVEAGRRALTAPPSPTFLAVYIGTTNDTNGNPRRGWYVSRLDGAPMIAEVPPNGRNAGKDAAYTCWVEEGYGGRQSLLRVIGGTFEPGEVTTSAYNVRVSALVHETGRIGVTPGEYRSARKLPRVGGAE
jgi:hypothetical protein